MDWLKISSLIALLPHLLCAMVQSQPSPCSEYFTYMTTPGITDILGQIKIRPPSANDTFFLKVALSTTTELVSQVARLELARSIQESLENVHQGRPLLYHVYYNLTHESIPSMSAIWFNNQRYCPSPEINGNITATIELGHILYPPNEEPLLYKYTWQLNLLPWLRNSSIYRIDNPSYDRLNYESELNNVCGITSYYTDETNRLISDGEKTLPGQWPWLVAIYIQHTDKSVYDFECAGSLITTRHIITAKLCLVSWRENFEEYTLTEPQVYVSFGQFKSREWYENHTGIINRAVAGFRENDYLRILILKTAVEYNAFIRPVCLWSGSSDLQDIVNMTGYIIGWGYDVTRLESEHARWDLYTGEPRMAKVPLMNLSIEPNENIFRQYDTQYTIQTYTTYRPCYIDNGGGLVVFNTTMGRYQLRGIMYLCDELGTKLYIDVANQTFWIRQQISNT